MSRATSTTRARALAIFAAALLTATAMVLMLRTAPAEAAKPCWERVIDDWSDNGRIDGVYSARCIEDARKHLPEDVRAYSDIEEKLDAELQESGRSPQGGSGGSSGGSGGGSGDPTDPPVVGEPEPDTATGPKDESPIQSVLGSGTTDASSIPLPLIILAALALLLMAAGAAGLVARKLQARRSRAAAP
jgi:hypothetical protein